MFLKFSELELLPEPHRIQVISDIVFLALHQFVIQESDLPQICKSPTLEVILSKVRCLSQKYLEIIKSTT